MFLTTHMSLIGTLSLQYIFFIIFKTSKTVYSMTSMATAAIMKKWCVVELCCAKHLYREMTLRQLRFEYLWRDHDLCCKYRYLNLGFLKGNFSNRFLYIQTQTRSKIKEIIKKGYNSSMLVLSNIECLVSSWLMFNCFWRFLPLERHCNK